MWVVGQELLPIEHVGGVSDHAIRPQTQSVEDLAEVATCIRRNPILLDGQLARPLDFLAVQVLQRQPFGGEVFPATFGMATLNEQALVLGLRHPARRAADAFVRVAFIHERPHFPPPRQRRQ